MCSPGCLSACPGENFFHSAPAHRRALSIPTKKGAFFILMFFYHSVNVLPPYRLRRLMGSISAVVRKNTWEKQLFPLHPSFRGSIIRMLSCWPDKANPLCGCESRSTEVTDMVKAIVGANWGDEGRITGVTHCLTTCRSTSSWKCSTMRSIQAVSYTHLDVYKRQEIGEYPCRPDSCNHGRYRLESSYRTGSVPEISRLIL